MGFEALLFEVGFVLFQFAVEGGAATVSAAVAFDVLFGVPVILLLVLLKASSTTIVLSMSPAGEISQLVEYAIDIYSYNYTCKKE